MARAFVTGGSGLIGGALIDRLVARGDAVVAAVRSDAAARKVAARGARPARAELLDEAQLAAAMTGSDVVFHVAGLNTLLPADPQGMVDANVRAPAAVVRAAARAEVPRVVHTSSAATLGERENTVGAEDSPHRGTFLSPYERTKHDGEVAAFAAARASGIELVAVNPSSVQGPGRAGGTARILLAYVDGRLPVFIDTRMSLVDIDDCVTGHLLAAERGRPGERYVLNGATLRSDEAIALVEELTGARHRVRTLPPRVALAAAAAIERACALAGRRPPVSRAMVRTMLHGHAYDGSRATRELGLRYTPIRDTLERTIAWAVAAGHVRRPLPRPPGAAIRPAAPRRGVVSSQEPNAGAFTMDHPEREHPDYARGERTKPEDEREPDFARGARTEPEEDAGPDFARGERTRPPEEAGPDFARGARTEQDDD